MKKLLFLLALSLCSLVTCAQSFSDFAPTGQILYYSIISSSAHTVMVTYAGSPSPSSPWSGYPKPTGSLTIPSMVRYGENSYSVTNIGDDAFYYCDGLTSVTIPNSVTTIGDETFAGCSSLTSVTIPNSVTTIGDKAFYQCIGLTNVTIPNSVTTIGDETFYQCTGLTSVTIPNSVTTIGTMAFYSCGLTNVTIGNSVTTIGNAAFWSCDKLKTVYNYSSDIICTTSSNFYAGPIPERVIISADVIFAGVDANQIVKIDSTKFTVGTTGSTNVIPIGELADNHIAYDGSAWKARNIVITDDTSRFNSIVAFTAETATYTREFTNSNRSTLCLPFTAAVPEGFEVYDFAGFDGHTLTFSNHEGDIAAYTPYLVGYDLSKEGSTTQCTFTQENVVFPKTSTATPACTTTYNGMTFKGTMERKCMNSSCYGYKDGFFVRSANGSEHNAHAHVNPFRCYFAYTAPAGASQPLPQTLNVEVGYGDPVGIDAVETPEQEYDGRYGKDVYDMLGRLVRKNADNLEGLPKGVYIWKGKKLVVS